MGNRGLIHNDRQEIVRHSQLKRWIYCKLEFKGWHRKVMRPGHYTELFFLDEATALAAGHRPCMECQRDRATEFKRIWNEVNEPVRTLVEMDEVLRFECAAEKPAVQVSGLPSGAMVALDDQFYLVKNGATYRWSFEGYDRTDLSQANFKLITPLPIVKIIAAGFQIDLS
jgi:hypothetical protein